MISVDFPEPNFNIKKQQNGHYVFDAIRKRWLLLTEEEWVRQNIVNCLLKKFNYPATVIALEKEIKLHDLKKRFDVLVYDAAHQPWMLIECKSSSTELNEKVLEQVLRYNISVPVHFVIITNGKETRGWKKSGHRLEEIHEFPAWSASSSG